MLEPFTVYLYGLWGCKYYVNISISYLKLSILLKVKFKRQLIQLIRNIKDLKFNITCLIIFSCNFLWRLGVMVLWYRLWLWWWWVVVVVGLMVRVGLVRVGLVGRGWGEGRRRRRSDRDKEGGELWRVTAWGDLPLTFTEYKINTDRGRGEFLP